MGSLSRGGSVPPQGVSLFHPGVGRPAPGMGRRGDPPRPRRPGDAHEPGIVEMVVSYMVPLSNLLPGGNSWGGVLGTMSSHFVSFADVEVGDQQCVQNQGGPPMNCHPGAELIL